MTRFHRAPWHLVAVVVTAASAFLGSATAAAAAPPVQTPTQTPTPAPSGVLTGQVFNRSTNRPVPEVTVRLRHWQREVEGPPLTLTADAGGNYRFEGLDASAHAFYRLEADYQGITFPSEFVAFQPGITETVAAVDVYETTDRADAIRVERFHFIIMAREPGVLSILELYQFANQTDHAYVGAVNADGQRETVRIALPPGAQDLALQSGSLGEDFLSRPTELVATAPVLPGAETFDVAFLYLVPYDTPSLALDRRLYYDTLAINGLLMDAGAELQSEVLAFTGERAAQGQNFLQYTGENVPADQTLPLLLSRLDSIRFGNSPEAAGDADPASAGALGHVSLMYVMLSLGGALVALGIGYPLLRRRSAAETLLPAEDAGVARQRLLLTLARLDEAYQAGQISAPAYQRARAHRKAELAALWHCDRDSS